MASKQAGYVEKSFTIIAQQLTMVSTQVSAKIGEIFQSFPEPPNFASIPKKQKEESRNQYENTIFNFLDPAKVSEGEIRKVIHNTSIVASSKPDDNFIEFYNLLPKLDLEAQDKPDFSKSPMFTFFRTTLKWDQFYQRVAFQFYNDTILCNFLHKLLLVSPDISETESLAIFDKVIQLWYPERPLPPFYQKLRLRNANKWAHIISILSAKVPVSAAKELIDKMPCGNDEEIIIQIYLNLFKWVYIGPNSKVNYDTLPKRFKDLETIASRSKTDGPIHGPAMEFFTNLMGYLLYCHPPYRSNQFIYELSEIAKKYTKEKGYVGPAFSLRALIYRFQQHQKMKLTLEEYSQKYIDKNLVEDAAPYHIESYTFFVRGLNYQAHCQLEVTQANYQWRYPPEEKSYMEKFMNKVLSNPNLYRHSQVQLAEYFAQYASNDFKEFIDTHYNKIMDVQFANRNAYALFLFAHKILSPTSKFTEYAEKGHDKEAMKKMKNKLYLFVESQLKSNLPKLVDKTHCDIYLVTSFVETLNLSNPKEMEDKKAIEFKLNNCLDQLPTNSFPKENESEPTSKIISGVEKNRFKLLEARMNKLIFQPITINPALTKAKIEFTKHVDILQALSILPFLTIQNETVNFLVSLTYSKDAHIASLANRVLQTFIHIDTKWFNPIMLKICAVTPLTPEHQFIQLQSLLCCIQSGLFTHTNLVEQTEQHLFNLIILALCSNSFYIRTYALNLAQQASMLYERKDFDLYSFLADKAMDINSYTQILVLTFGSFKLDVDISESGVIEFQLMCKANYDNLYFFALESLANSLRDNTKTENLIPLKDMLMESIGSLAQSEPITKINTFIFLAGIVSEKEGNLKFFVDQNTPLQDTMKSVTSTTLASYAAYYSAFTPDIGIAILTTARFESSLPVVIATKAFISRIYASEMKEQTDFVVKLSSQLLRLFKKVSSKKLWLDDLLDQVNESKSFEDIKHHDDKNLLFNTSKDWSCFSDEMIVFALAHYLITSIAINKKFFLEQSNQLPGPYARPSRLKFESIATTKNNKDDNLKFALLLNLASIKNSKEIVPELAARCLDSFIQIYHIPSVLSNLLRDNLSQIMEISFKTAEIILSQFFIDNLSTYIAGSYKSAEYFKVISYQYLRANTMTNFYDSFSSIIHQETNESDNDFINTTYRNTGSLLAFAFYYLTSTDSAENRQNGYYVLFNVALGSIFIQEGPFGDSIPDLFRDLMTLRPLINVQHPELTERLLVRISRIVHQELSIFTEQFLKVSFELIKLSPGNSVFLSILVPWVDNLVFNRPENGILKSEKKDFVCLSTFTFFRMLVENVISVPLNRSHVLLLDQILKQPSEDGISTLEFFVAIIYKLYQKNSSNEDKCIELLKYLLGHDKKEVVRFMSQFLAFKGWFYYSIQVNRVDIANDVDKFLESFTEQNDVDEAESYQTFVNFTIKAFLNIMSVDLKSTSSVDYILLLFCLTNYKEFKLTENLLSLLFNQGDLSSIAIEKMTILDHSGTNQFTNGRRRLLTRTSTTKELTCRIGDVNSDEIEDHISFLSTLSNIHPSMIANALDYIEDFTPEKKQLFCLEALKWAVDCGDLSLAQRAASLFIILVDSANDNILNVIIRAIYIMDNILMERVDIRNSKRQFLSAMGTGNQIPQYDSAINYVTLLLNILYKCHSIMKTPHAETFYTALSFLQFKEAIQMPMVTAALKILLAYFRTEKDFVHDVMNELGDSFPNLLRPLLDMNHSEKSLSLAFDLLCELTIHYPKCLIKDDMSKYFAVPASYNTNQSVDDESSSEIRSKISTKSGIAILILALIPYIFENQYQSNIKPIIDSLQKEATSYKLNDLKSVLKPPNSGSPDDFAKSLVPKLIPLIEQSEFPLITKFYTMIISNSKSLFSATISACTPLVADPKINVPVQLFEEIGFLAVKDKETSRNTLILEFLTNLNSKKGLVKKGSSDPKTMKVVPPLKLKIPIELATWSLPDGVDPFGKIEDLPPLSVVDDQYLGCPFQRPISVAVQQVKVEPFATWAVAMFRSESFQIQEDEVDEAKSVQAHIDDAKANDILKIFKNALARYETSAMKGFSQSFEILDIGRIDLEEEREYDGFSSSRRKIKRIKKKKKTEGKDDDLDNVETLNNQNPYALEQWASKMREKIFSTTVFAPSREEIESIGADILDKDLETPNLFPAVRY